MKTTATAAAFLGLASVVLGQLPPSPTASVGCEPHGDHWHCDGPAVTGTPTGTGTAAPAATTSSHHHDDDDDDDHDHDHASGTGSLAPSPSESAGCEPHGDHWHCTGPKSGSNSSSKTLAPSPTNSVGCQPHGDHWHCDGPKTTTTGPITTISNIPQPTGAANTTRTTVAPNAGNTNSWTVGAVTLAGLVLAAAMTF